MALLKFSKLIKQEENDLEKYSSGELEKEDRDILHKAADRFIRMGVNLNYQDSLYLTKHEKVALFHASLNWERDKATLFSLLNLTPRSEENAVFGAKKAMDFCSYTKEQRLEEAFEEAAALAFGGQDE